MLNAFFRALIAYVEKKLAAKEDLKMTDVLRYHEADSIAAKDLM